MSIRLFRRILFALAVSGLMPLSTAYAINTCYWSGGTGPVHYLAEVGALYIARDARVGDPIGPVERPFVIPNEGSGVHCILDDLGNRLTVDVSARVPLAPGLLSSMSGMNRSGTVLTTNIDGVGAVIKFGRPYDGSITGFWILNSPDSTAPFNGYIDFQTPYAVTHNVWNGTITLIKTAPIAPGVHTLDSGREMVSVSFTGIPNAMGLSLNGSVTQAECSLSANPVSADPVELGDWPHSHFTGEGQTTDPVPFTIALNHCRSDSLPGGTVTHANIRLDPTAGSETLDAAQGIFSLGNGSTAQGVGIQILGSDALTPVALGSEVVQGAIPPSGGMLLEFHARYYQTAPARGIRAGSAGGALGFTITYK